MSKLLIPNEYQLINEVFPEMGFPTKDGETYGIRTEEFDAIILKCIVPEQVAMNFDNPQVIIDNWHNDMPDNYGIIEVNNGLTKNGNKYVYFIMKHSLGTEDNPVFGNGYLMNINIKLGNDIYFINSSFTERGITGARDNTIYMMFLQKYPDLEDPYDGWASDPYDSTYKEGFLMNLSEDEIYDDLFPNHPLSKAREFVEFILDNN